MKKLSYLLSLISFLLLLIFSQPISASDASSSSTMTQKLHDLQSEIASKAASLQNTVTEKIDNKAFIGTITNKTDTTLSLTLTDGSSQSVSYSQYTDIPKKVKENDYVAVLGGLDDKFNLVARRIVKVSQNDDSAYTQIWGKIISVTGANFIIQTKDHKKLAIYTNLATNFQLGKDLVESDHLENNKMVVVVGEQNGQRFNARFVYIVPSGAIIKPAVTPSPNTTSSPSASPKKK